MKSSPEYLVTWIREYFGEDAIEGDAVDVTIDGLSKMIGRLRLDGMEAMDTLAKIRAFEREFSESRMNAYQSMTAIAGIIDEAKP